MTFTDDPSKTPAPQQHPNPGIGKIIAFGILAVLLGIWLLLPHLLPTTFTPVVLDHQEQTALESKVRSMHLDLKTSPQQSAPLSNTSVTPPVSGASVTPPVADTLTPPGDKTQPAGVLTPEKFIAAAATHEVTFTQREINALIATNTNLGDRVAVDLSPGLVSALVLVPMDPQMPVLGGKSVRISAGLSVDYKDGKPVFVLKGVTVWGVALPHAWLGDMKNTDVVHEYGDDTFWKNFTAGVDKVTVGDGILTIRLKE